MDAIISGSSGVALLLDGAGIKSLHAGAPGETVPRSAYESRLLLGDSNDIEMIENADLPLIERRLDLAVRAEEALTLSLIVLDPDLSSETREEAAVALDELLADNEVAGRTEHVLLAKPLPSAADTGGALACCERVAASRAEHFVASLRAFQPAVRSARSCWDAVPDALFGTGEAKPAFHAFAVRGGLFSKLVHTVASGKLPGSFLVESMLDPSVREMPNYRQVLMRWVAPLQPDAMSAAMTDEPEGSTEGEATESRPLKPRQRPSFDRREVFATVQRQKMAILAQVVAHNDALVSKFTDGLVQYQLRHGETKYACMSLCHLAIYAKREGDYDMQFLFTERAVGLAPKDGWAWAQHADALLKRDLPDQAMEGYHLAGVFGRSEAAKAYREEVVEVMKGQGEEDSTSDLGDEEDNTEVIAKNGRAEVLKAMNRLEEALAAYEAVIQEHPRNAVAKNGRAEVLKAMNRLDEALPAYEAVIEEHPSDLYAKSGRAEVLKAMNRLDEALAAYDAVLQEHPRQVVAKNGRAGVLKAMNRLDEALSAYDAVISEHPRNVVPKNGRAEVLKEMSRLDDALAAYDAIILERPREIFAKTGRAEVLKDMNRLDEALSAYDAVIQEHPRNAFAMNGRAEVLKDMNRLEDALAAYDEAVAQSPWNSVARNGRACVLAALGRWDEALRLLPEVRPTTQQDWIAYHTRGMILLRQGEVEQAVRIFQDGLAHNPRPSSRDYFRTALAAARLNQRKYAQAAEVLREIETLTRLIPANVLRVHAFGHLGECERATEAFAAIASRVPSGFEDLWDELGERYAAYHPPRRDDQWLIAEETRYLLVAD